MRFSERKTIARISVPKAREIIKEGMLHFLGGIPKWVEAYDAVAEWMEDNEGKGLLAAGGMGLGKTKLCCDVMADVLRDQGLQPLVISAYNMSNVYKELFCRKAIIIDDIGTEDVASFYGERHDIFKEIVDHAEKNGILLVITTNLNGEQLNQRYGSRVIYRLYNIVKPVIFSGESLRGTKLLQPFFVYGIRFDDEKTADDFAAEQERIREGIEKGTIRLFDDWATEAYELQEALSLRNGVAYKYGMEK